MQIPAHPNRPLLPLWHQDAKKGQEHELLVPLGPMPTRGRSTTFILGVRPLNLGLPLLGRCNVVLGAWWGHSSTKRTESSLLSLPVLLPFNMSVIHVTLQLLFEAEGPLHLIHQLANP